MKSAPTTQDDDDEAVFETRITFRTELALRERMVKQAEAENRSLSNWLRGLAVRELDRVGG